MKRIFLIDDDRDDIELFKEALEEVEPACDFHYFENAQSALEALRNINTILPSLIFLDINLPIINGWDFLKLVKGTQNLSNIPVIMYTTSSYGKEKEKAYGLGAHSFISKPSDFDELKTLLRNELNKHFEKQPER